MSDGAKKIAHIYSKVVKDVVGDLGLARKVVMWTPEKGVHEITIAGPHCKVALHGSRLFRTTETGKIQVHCHMNNPNAGQKPYLDIFPTWRKFTLPDGSTYEVLTGILDERGGKVKFRIIDDMMEG